MGDRGDLCLRDRLPDRDLERIGDCNGEPGSIFNAVLIQ